MIIKFHIFLLRFLTNMLRFLFSLFVHSILKCKGGFQTRKCKWHWRWIVFFLEHCVPQFSIIQQDWNDRFHHHPPWTLAQLEFFTWWMNESIISISLNRRKSCLCTSSSGWAKFNIHFPVCVLMHVHEEMEPLVMLIYSTS